MSFDDKNIALLKRISLGDSDAFRIFYDENYVNVYRFASYFIKKHEIIEEVVADVFFNIWDKRKRLSAIENFKSMLYTMTRNKELDYIRAFKHQFSIDEISVGIESKEMYIMGQSIFLGI